MVRKGSPRRISKDTEHFGKQNGGGTDSRWNQHKQRLRRGSDCHAAERKDFSALHEYVVIMTTLKEANLLK